MTLTCLALLVAPLRNTLKTVTLFALALYLGFAIGAAGQAQANENQTDAQVLARIQTYLSAVDSLQAGFIQIAPGEPLAQGNFFLQRGGFLRMDYHPPNPNLIIANGHVLAFFDRSLESRTIIDLADTLAYPLISNPDVLGQDFAMVEKSITQDSLAATFISTTAPEQGYVTLSFRQADDDLTLEGWTIVDAHQQTTQITLIDLRPAPELAPSLFSIYDVYS
ncbi:MAG: outer membrane lipoprotein carrier protein LolA [Pseudomonadota bacterium]